VVVTDVFQREKILEELKLMSLLKHPNVVLLMGAYVRALSTNVC
jgi:hypothetical protein